MTIKVNGPPVANDDGDPTPINITEDTPTNIDVLANDTDPNLDPLTVSSVTQGAHGTITNNGTDVTYSPNLNYNGDDSFTYEVCDDGSPQLCDTATVFVRVTPVNDPPNAVDDLPGGVPIQTINEDPGFALDIPTSTLLSNDTDPEGDTLTINSVTTPSSGGGSVSLR